MWIGFVTLGLWVAVVWACLHYRKLSLPKRLVGVLIVSAGFGAALVIVLPAEVFLDDRSWYQSSPYREGIAFVLMLFGMASRYITNAIEQRRRIISESSLEHDKRPGIQFDAWEFSYPLFVSVITFGVLLQQMGDEQLTLANLILSFQTGFFWQTLLAKSGESQFSVSKAT